MDRAWGIAESPQNGFWAMELYANKYQALTSPRTALPLSEPHSRVGSSWTMKLGMSPSIVWLMGPTSTLSPGLLLWASSAFLLPLVLPSNPSDHLPLNLLFPSFLSVEYTRDEPIIGTDHIYGDNAPKAPAEPAVKAEPL